MRLFLFSFVFAFYFLFPQTLVYGESVCQPIYGGGKTCIANQAVKTKPIQIISSQITPPILSPVPLKSTPPTGPQELPLMLLFSTGTIGFILRLISFAQKNKA